MSSEPSPLIAMSAATPPIRPRVLALDLEGTLISNAVSQIPRPGLYAFLVRCQDIFERVVIYTTVSEKRFRTVARLLADEKLVPEWFVDMEFVDWQGSTKDLAFVRSAQPEEVILVDDFEIYVHPGQHDRWARVEQFQAPYPASDQGLLDVLQELERRVAAV